MAAGVGTYGEQLVAALSAATGLLRDLPGRVSRLTGPDLDVVLPAVDALAAVAAAGRFTVAGEAQSRGEVAASQAGSLSQWVGDRCPSLDAREAGLVAKAVSELCTPTLRAARDAVADGRLSVAAGCVLAAEWRQLAPLVEPDAADAVLTGLVSVGETSGSAGVRGLRPALLARYGLGQRLQQAEDRHAGLTVLSCGHDIGGGITEYRLRLNPEARAVVEAAINPLAAPASPLAPTVSADGAADRAQGADGGVGVGGRDPRTVDQRRGQALVEVCRRATAAGMSPSAPSGVKATVLVTIGLDDLRGRTRPGTLVGGVDAGTLLGPETVRKLACDGTILPVLVGADGHPLTLGRSRRWFTPAQAQALWLRDRRCTFPGCAVPATWCDAHHVTHWVDGGPTDVGNAALLCGRHHTIVHRDRLTADITQAGVHWDRRPGSYDRALTRIRSPDGPAP
jgi:Domain of unknown function (DUF222)